MWSWISLAIVLILTFLGKTAYSILEKALKIIVPVFFVLILIITILSFNLDNFVLALKGLINFGWFPQNINLEVFLGATVFAGAGGLLNLAVSLWYKDKGIGMGSYAGKITNPITGKTEAIPATGYKFETTQNNLKNGKMDKTYNFRPRINFLAFRINYLNTCFFKCLYNFNSAWFSSRRTRYCNYSS